MRIMHVMAGAPEGGAENIMLESVLALAEAGLEQHVVTRPDNQFRVQKFREAGIGVDTASFNTMNSGQHGHGKLGHGELRTT